MKLRITIEPEPIVEIREEDLRTCWKWFYDEARRQLLHEEDTDQVERMHRMWADRAKRAAK